MRNNARAIRKIIRHIENAWVREYSNGTIAAGAGHGLGPGYTSESGMREVRQALEAAGYRCEANGKPGTEGQFILDVFAPLEESAPALDHFRFVDHGKWSSEKYGRIVQDQTFIERQHVFNAWPPEAVHASDLLRDRNGNARSFRSAETAARALLEHVNGRTA